MNVAFPNITATGNQALEQIKSYLFRLSEQLNYELNRLSTETTKIQVTTSEKGIAAAKEAVDAQAQFNAIKSLIINSADIVTAYSEEINKRLKGEYVANDEVYGTFKQTTENFIQASSESITQNYRNIQQIISDLLPEGEGEERTLTVNAHIKTGLLEYDGDVPIYGVEIGKTMGDKSFSRFARFTESRLSFYAGEIEVAYFSSNKLYITNAEILSSLTVGDYTIKADADGGITFVWSAQ